MANNRSPWTCATLREPRPHSPTVHQLFFLANSGKRSLISTNVRRTPCELCPSSRESARSSTWTGEQFTKNVFVSGYFQIFGKRSPRTRSPGVRRKRVRQKKTVCGELLSASANVGEPSFAAKNCLRQTIVHSKKFAANCFFGELVRGKLFFWRTPGELVRGERSFAVNKCSPTFAANDRSPQTNVRRRSPTANICLNLNDFP